MRYYAMHLTGACRSGSDKTSTLTHAVDAATGDAVCGRTYGRHSAGWSDRLDDAVTCPRCLRKLAKMADAEMVAP